MPLCPLSRIEARQYYTNRGINDPDKVKLLLHQTKGLPLAIALSADTADFAEPAPVDHAATVAGYVRRALFDEVASSDVQEILEVLCILPHANQALLNRILNYRITPAQLGQLGQLSFIRPTAEGIALHDVARAYLSENFIRRDPVRYHELRLKIVDDTCRLLNMADARDKPRIAAGLLAICRDVLPLRLFNGSTDPLASTMEWFQPADLHHLHGLITEQGQMAISLPHDRIHDCLDALAEQFPNNIRVFRSDSGKPLAFMCGVLLYRETMGLLDRFISDVLDACFQDEADVMRQLSLEEADTYYLLFGAATAADPNYSCDELNGIMLTDGYSRVPVFGIRSVLVTKVDVHIYAHLGFSMRALSGLPETHPANGDTILELDFRKADFGDWVHAYVQAAGAASVAQTNVTLTAEDIKLSLDVIHDAERLGQTIVAATLNCSGMSLQQRLREIIYAVNPVPPVNRSKQALLQLLCDHSSIRPEKASQLLHMARATYYRQRRQALLDILQLLGL